MRIVILGASGQIGSALLHALQALSFDVLGTSRHAPGCKKLVQFDPFHDDWTLLGKVDVLVNCIGIINEKGMDNFEQIHIGLTRLMIRHRALLGHPKLIQVSALGAAIYHPARFLKTKGIADVILLQANNSFVVRPSIVCTPGTMLVRKFCMLGKWAKRAGNFLLLPQGFLSAVVQPVLISDLVAVITKLVVEAPSFRIIDVVGPDEIGFYELVDFSMQGRWRYKEVNERMARFAVKHVVAPLFPGIITYDQYQLLFCQNTSHSAATEWLLGRKPVSTKSFWRESLKVT